MSVTDKETVVIDRNSANGTLCERFADVTAQRKGSKTVRRDTTKERPKTNRFFASAHAHNPLVRRRCLLPLTRWRALCSLYCFSLSQSRLPPGNRSAKNTTEMVFTTTQGLLMSLFKLLGLLAVVSRSSVSGLDVDILTCADVQNINAALVQDHITARFADLWCEEWQTVVVHEMDEERELRIESLPDKEGQQQELTLKSVRFDIGRGVAVTFASDVHISRSAYHPQVGQVVVIHAKSKKRCTRLFGYDLVPAAHSGLVYTISHREEGSGVLCPLIVQTQTKRRGIRGKSQSRSCCFHTSARPVAFWCFFRPLFPLP